MSPNRIIIEGPSHLTDWRTSLVDKAKKKNLIWVDDARNTLRLTGTVTKPVWVDQWPQDEFIALNTSVEQIFWSKHTKFSDPKTFLSPQKIGASLHTLETEKEGVGWISWQTPILRKTDFCKVIRYWKGPALSQMSHRPCWRPSPAHCTHHRPTSAEKAEVIATFAQGLS